MNLAKLIGTGFGSGYSPFAPGTAGALLASAIWAALLLVGYDFAMYATLGLLITFTFAGVWAANKLESIWGKDPSRVVVDEMVGVWIALQVVPPCTKEGWYWYAIGALVLFRLFDIFKPLGIRRMESLPGGWGVMMDDILAGVYSLILLVAAQCLVG